MKNNILIGLGIVILIIGAYYLGVKNNTQQTDIGTDNTTVSTTTNTATDNSSVPSVPTTGTFKPVVKTTTTTTTSGNYIKIGQRVSINGVYITPSKVTYDSRCTKDIQCVQAGTVELGVLLENGSLSQSPIIVLGKPFFFAERQITLTSVTPSKLSTKVLKDSDYRFTITVR